MVAVVMMIVQAIGGYYKLCKYCGKKFWVKPSHSGKRIFCSREKA